MARHIYTGTTAPNFSPTEIGQHYVDTATGQQYQSKGIASPSDWVLLSPASSVDWSVLTNIPAPVVNLSGTNTGDQDLSSLVVKNAAIVGGTKTKITYDSKGLVTSGADATTADIADSLNKRYVTDSQLTVIGNTSNINTGDQIISDATITTTDITTNDASASKHGFLKKLSNIADDFLNGQGSWTSFLASVLGSVLTGLSTATSTAVSATDTILVAIGKLQAQISAISVVIYPWNTIQIANTYTNSSSTTWVTIDDMTSNLVAGKTYFFRGLLIYKTASTNTGIVGQNTGTALGEQSFYAITGGTSSTIVYRSWVSKNVATTFTSAAYTDTPILMNLEGYFTCTQGGTFLFQFRSEVNGSLVTVLPKSYFEVKVV